MKPTFVADIGHLPTHASGPRSLTWWGTLAFIAIEGMGFVLAIATYLYLAENAGEWPLGLRPPGVAVSVPFTLLTLLSLWPNALAKRAGARMDLRRTRLMLVVMSLTGLALLGLRAFEFGTLNARWDDNAYGSVVWALLALHTLHLATDWMDTLVLTALSFTRHMTPRRFSDVDDNAVYWLFVVAAWLPLFAVIYLLPRL